MFKNFFPKMEEEGAEGGGGGGGGEIAEWAKGLENDGLKSTLGQFESQEAFFKEIGYEPPKPEEKDWRDGLDEDLGKVASRFNSPADVLRAVQDFRKRDSQIRVPGKDASEEDIAKYKTAIGVPESPEDYEWPDVPKDQMTDDLKASREVWGKRMHDLGIPKDAAKALAEMINEDAEAYEKSQVEADAEFVKASEAALRKEWGGDYDKNMTLANRAAEKIAEQSGVDFEALKQIETKDGRFLLDNPEIARMFSAVGREMDEGSLAPSLTESESESIQEQISTLRAKIEEAQAAGKNKEANKLYQKEQALVAKLNGNKPVVGAGGRSV